MDQADRPRDVHAEPQWSWQELPFICDPEAGIRGLQNFARYADKSQLDQKLLTWEDVARCDGLHGSPLYVVFDNSVYDVTEFADFHPGGRQRLADNAGKDVSLAMRAAGMPNYIFNNVLKIFRVGQIKTN